MKARFWIKTSKDSGIWYIYDRWVGTFLRSDGTFMGCCKAMQRKHPRRKNETGRHNKKTKKQY
jgi:hypothetical protein